MSVVKSIASVIWNNRGIKTSKKRAKVSVEEEDLDDFEEDDSGDDAYTELNDAQQRKNYKTYLLTQPSLLYK